MVSFLFVKKIINDKKNIVIEIIGDSADLITPVIDKMREIGYHLSSVKIRNVGKVALFMLISNIQFEKSLYMVFKVVHENR